MGAGANPLSTRDPTWARMHGWRAPQAGKPAAAAAWGAAAAVRSPGALPVRPGAGERGRAGKLKKQQTLTHDKKPRQRGV